MKSNLETIWSRIPEPPNLPDGFRESVEQAEATGKIPAPMTLEVSPGNKITMSGEEQRKFARALIDLADACADRNLTKLMRAMAVLQGGEKNGAP